MISKGRIVDATEFAIGVLAKAFIQNPRFFYTENDLHCFLYRQILNKLPFEELQCKTGEGYQSILLHKEYPTKLRYNAKAL
jgi:hypothetical protein